MRKKITFSLFALLTALGLYAQSLNPSVNWGALEKIDLGGQELVVSSGNDGRNLIQYWNREATLVIGNRLFFKAAPPTNPEVVRIDTTYKNVTGSTLGILASELGNYANHCGDTYILDSRPHPGGNADSLQIFCKEMFVDTIWKYNYIHQLWYTEGTTATTKRVPDTENLKEPMHLINAGTDLVFTAIDIADGVRYIYRFNGTTTVKS
jgi:hypothetical protein